MSSPIQETFRGYAEAFAYPNREANLGHHEHDAAHGSSLVDLEPATGIWDRVHGENTMRQIKSQGNCGGTHEFGLKSKAVMHQERLAERTRLAREGKFEAYTTHDAMVNFDDEHRNIAQGSQVFGGPNWAAAEGATLGGATAGVFAVEKEI